MKPVTCRRKGRDGFSMLETLLLAVVLMIGVGAVGLTMINSAKLQKSTDRYLRASRAARSVIEELRSNDLLTTMGTVASKPDDPNSPHKVEVEYPEELLAAVFGGAIPTSSSLQDADGDGQVEPNGASPSGAVLLPVEISVAFEDGEISYRTLLTDR